MTADIVARHKHQAGAVIMVGHWPEGIMGYLMCALLGLAHGLRVLVWQRGCWLADVAGLNGRRAGQAAKLDLHQYAVDDKQVLLPDGDSATLLPCKVMGLTTTYVIDARGRVICPAVDVREFDHEGLHLAVFASAPLAGK